MELTLWHLIAFIVFVISCSYYNFKSGMHHGINATLDTLQKGGIIDIDGVNIEKTKKKINEDEN